MAGGGGPLQAEANRQLVEERLERLRCEAALERVARIGRPGATSAGDPRRPGGRHGSSTPRRRLLAETAAVYVPVVGFGLVYGIAARTADFGLLDLESMNLFVFAGGSQLIAVGMIASGLPWAWIVAVTALLNGRHLLYGVSLAPWFAGRPLALRALAAYPVVDESFALALSHFRRVGRADIGGYAIVGLLLAGTWFTTTTVGWALAAEIPPILESALKVVVPASVAGMAVLLVSDRATAAAAAAALVIGTAVALLAGPAVGVVAGGVLGPVVTWLLDPARSGASGRPARPDGAAARSTGPARNGFPAVRP